jgi:hypothetical protein
VLSGHARHDGRQDAQSAAALCRTVADGRTPGLLGFGARWLAPWFARPKAWQVLDGLIGLTMWVLVALLVRHALAGF